MESSRRTRYWVLSMLLFVLVVRVLYLPAFAPVAGDDALISDCRYCLVTAAESEFMGVEITSVMVPLQLGAVPVCPQPHPVAGLYRAIPWLLKAEKSPVSSAGVGT